MVHLPVSCPLNGQGMLTWMMESILNSASAEIQQQYADEIMKHQLLKIHQENAKMESAIVLTDMRKISSPPVDEVLVALSSTTDISATDMNSGVTEQKQENGNVNVNDDEMMTLIPDHPQLIVVLCRLLGTPHLDNSCIVKIVVS